ncbi:hypothetical protein EJ02DRAFT_476002 [Clathrospora elynae]|uniref:Uncharacterized protein n=1 Tax=Clathrospora elynae TaxID=706981 RepID=A0A6A5SDG4_9PLEO|nr:hypothetical protein EJ02DRAFT_476002 [Clathrospora elynae]
MAISLSTGYDAWNDYMQTARKAWHVLVRGHSVTDSGSKSSRDHGSGGRFRCTELRPVQVVEGSASLGWFIEPRWCAHDPGQFPLPSSTYPIGKGTNPLQPEVQLSALLRYAHQSTHQEHLERRRRQMNEATVHEVLRSPWRGASSSPSADLTGVYLTLANPRILNLEQPHNPTFPTRRVNNLLVLLHIAAEWAEAIEHTH